MKVFNIMERMKEITEKVFDKWTMMITLWDDDTFKIEVVSTSEKIRDLMVYKSQEDVFVLIQTYKDFQKKKAQHTILNSFKEVERFWGIDNEGN